jgi:amino acid adenylation domain-containing protein
LKTTELLARLKNLGVELRVEADRLIVNAPTGALSTQLRAELRDKKDELLAFFALARADTTRITAAPRSSPLPLSFGQQRLWYLEQLDPGTPVHTIAWAYRVEGHLELDTLKTALEQVVQRHEALRTTFDPAGTVTRVAASIELPFKVLDLRPLAPEQRNVDKILEEEGALPFDLVAGPLMRAVVLRLAEREVVLGLYTHHIVTDGWSLGVMMRELVALLQGSPLAPVPLHYGDFAVWQRSWLTGEVLEKQLSYWRSELAGELAPLDLPTDKSRPSVWSSPGATVAAQVPRDLTDALAALGKAEGASLFMVLLAAYGVFLASHASQDQVLVGSPIANRTRSELEGTVGFFANTLVLRVRGFEGSFRELLRQVRETCLGAYGHQDVPLERLVEALQPKRDTSRSALYQALFAFLDVSAPLRTTDGLVFSPIDVESRAAQTDIALWVRETGAGLALQLEYSTELFAEATAKRMLARFVGLLGLLSQDPTVAVRKLPMATRDEFEQLDAWNQTAAPLPEATTLHELISRQAARTPERVAVTCGTATLTYAELESRSNRLARYLQKHNVGSRVLVGICLQRSLEMLVTLLAVLKAGGAYVPLDPAFPPERLAYMLAHSKAPLVVTQSSLVRDLAPGAARTVLVDKEALAIGKESDAPVGCTVAPESPAYVLYTSGSTGKPKGVEVPHRAVVNFLASMAREPGMTADDVLVAVTTLSFDIAVLELYLPLTVGARVVIADREASGDGVRLLKLLQQSKATMLQGTPATWRVLLAAGWKSERLTCLCGGEALPADLARELLERAASLWNMYGPTETCVWSTCVRITDPLDITIGHPIANTQVYVVDSALERVPLGVPGELCIGGIGVATGYLHQPELTLDRFVPDPWHAGGRMYRTGDLCRIRNDGLLVYERRTDNQVKVRGYRIELGEIETVLREHKAVRDGVVGLREERAGDVRLIAYVVADPEVGVTLSDLRKHLRKRLPEYMIPQALVELDALPKTPNGKIDRKALVSLGNPARAASEAQTLPRTPAERVVSEVWSKALGTTRVGVHDNFFDLGGHSLLSMEVIAALRASTGKTLSPKLLLMGTLEQVARELQGAE